MAPALGRRGSALNYEMEEPSFTTVGCRGRKPADPPKKGQGCSRFVTPPPIESNESDDGVMECVYLVG